MIVASFEPAAPMRPFLAMIMKMPCERWQGWVSRTPPAWRWRGGLLFGFLAVDERLEVGAGPELGHRGLGHLNDRAGGRVAGRAGGAFALLEDPESGDGDLVTVRDGGLDGFEHRVHRFGRGFLVPQPSRDRVDQLTLVHCSLLRFPH